MVLACSAPRRDAQAPDRPGEIDLARPAPTPTTPICTEHSTDVACGSKTPPAPVDATIWNVPVTADDPVRGPAHALVSVVVFSDFECPHCRRGAGILEAFLEKRPGEVRVVWKDLPLAMHERSEPAALFARAVRAAQGDEGFWRAHDLLFERQPDFADADFERMASELGIDWAVASAAMKARLHAAPIAHASLLADEVAIDRAPTAFMNGRRLVGARSLETLETVFAEEAARARAALARGVRAEALYETLVADGKRDKAASDLP